MQQKELAARLGANVWTVHNWETNRTLPSIGWMPKIIDFLGYAPYVPPRFLEAWFEAVRRNLGVTRSQVARRIGIDSGTLTRWLQHRGCPPSDLHDQLREAILAMAGRNRP